MIYDFDSNSNSDRRLIFLLLETRDYHQERGVYAIFPFFDVIG